MYAQVETKKIDVIKETLRLLGSSIFSIRLAYNGSKTKGIELIKKIPGLIDQAIFVTQNMINDLYGSGLQEYAHYLLLHQKALEGLYSYVVELSNKENLTEEEVYLVLTYVADSIFNIERMV